MSLPWVLLYQLSSSEDRYLRESAVASLIDILAIPVIAPRQMNSGSTGICMFPDGSRIPAWQRVADSSKHIPNRRDISRFPNPD